MKKYICICECLAIQITQDDIRVPKVIYKKLEVIVFKDRFSYEGNRFVKILEISNECILMIPLEQFHKCFEVVLK